MKIILLEMFLRCYKCDQRNDCYEWLQLCKIFYCIIIQAFYISSTNIFGYSSIVNSGGLIFFFPVLLANYLILKLQYFFFNRSSLPLFLVWIQEFKRLEWLWFILFLFFVFGLVHSSKQIALNKQSFKKKKIDCFMQNKMRFIF